MLSDSRPARRRSKVTEEIVRAIQARVSQGELKPGEQLPPERQLAELFQASRGSIREALRALELSGLVHSRQGDGNFIAQSLPSALAVPLGHYLERQRLALVDLYEARQMLEPRLAFLAASRGTRADVERVRLALERQARDLKAEGLTIAYDADRGFHLAIAEAAGNQTFIKLHNYLSDLVSESRRELVDSATRREQALVDHRQIYEAIASGDGPAASAAMPQHLKTLETLLVEALEAYRAALDRLQGVPQRPAPASAPAPAQTAVQIPAGEAGTTDRAAQPPTGTPTPAVT
jgi:GntR family transcriptional regulator, transcriptional repressor for pyruvate dehydrogenase complex